MIFYLLAQQCAIPVFDGLFLDEHDASIQVLLFHLAEWHALAKLWLHTEDSLNLLEQSLRMLTMQLRWFVEVTCVAFQTKELPSEAAAQRQWQGQAQTENQSGPRTKTFNMLTYKVHALGDYVQTIWLFRTTDSYTTQIVSGIHDRTLQGCSLISYSGRTFPPFDQEVLRTYK